MEVVSDGEESHRLDRETKRDEYAKARIPEYWIVDPEQARITVLTLDGRSYRVLGEFSRGDLATSKLLPGFCVDVTSAVTAKALRYRSSGLTWDGIGRAPLIGRRGSASGGASLGFLGLGVPIGAIASARRFDSPWASAKSGASRSACCAALKASAGLWSASSARAR